MNMLYRLAFSICLVILQGVGISQAQTTLSWWKLAENPTPCLDGQAWSAEIGNVPQRFPNRAKGQVRDAVWNLSRNSAGLSIRFVSNSSQIVVRYKVSGSQALPHMPATGVSGVDLYGIDNDGTWYYVNAKYSFKDTITYQYNQLRPNDTYHKLGREYRLYLPLYNTPSDIEIGTEAGSLFTILPQRPEKPILVYGTSIMQGACASRPAMAWPTIVARNLDRTVLNFGFSGNGRMEKEVLTLLNELDPKIFVLDCLPNLISTVVDSTEVRKRLLEGVKMLRSSHPATPILLVEHAGYTEEYLMPHRKTYYAEANKILQAVWQQLMADKVPHLYLLTKAEINLQPDDMVDGTHPTDLGMWHYAQAYEAKIRTILNEPKGNLITQMPVRQRREPASYEWEDRHIQVLNLNKTEPSKIILIGNSITHNWGGKPLNNRIKAAASWQRYVEPYQTRNFGFGWDRVENVLWRVYHDELDGIKPEKIIINIGTNNLHLNTDDEIVQGLQQLVQVVRTRQPQAQIVLMGIYPRRAQEARVIALNKSMAAMTKSENVVYANIGEVLLQKDGKINESFFSDGLHPNATGYETLGKELEKLLK